MNLFAIQFQEALFGFLCLLNIEAGADMIKNLLVYRLAMVTIGNQLSSPLQVTGYQRLRRNQNLSGDRLVILKPFR